MSGYISIAGIGHSDDLQYLYTKTNSVEDIDFQTAGILNTSGINISNVISTNINEWNPVVRPGYCYIKNKEYYAYADKCTHVFSISDILLQNNTNYDDTDWPFQIDSIQNDVNNYCVSGYYTISGYHSINIPAMIPGKPIAITILPTQITPDYIDNNLSGLQYFGTMANGSSGYKYITSDYLSSEDLTQTIIGSFVNNSESIPRFSKYSPLAHTGFVEQYDKSVNYTFEPIIGHQSGILTLPCITVYNSDVNLDEKRFAQYIPDTSELLIPGSLTNIAIAYESSDSNELVLKDVNINPLNATDENQLITISHYNTSGIKYITPSVSDSVIASQLASVSNLHYSVIDENGIPCSGFRLSVSIDKKYYIENNSSGYIEIYPKYEAQLMNNVELYKIELPSEYMAYHDCAVIDENDEIQFFVNENNTTGIYYANGYGSLLGCGTYIINTSGYLYTDQNGSATCRYLANGHHLHPRRNYIATISASHPVCETSISKLYVQNTQQDEYYVTANDDKLPDIRTAIDIPQYTGSGYTLSKWPLGGPTTVNFYKANEWFHSYATMSGIPTILGIGLTINEHNHVTTNFVEPEEIVAIYKYIEAEVLKSDDYIILE